MTESTYYTAGVFNGWSVRGLMLPVKNPLSEIAPDCSMCAARYGPVCNENLCNAGADSANSKFVPIDFPSRRTEYVWLPQSKSMVNVIHWFEMYSPAEVMALPFAISTSPLSLRMIRTGRLPCGESRLMFIWAFACFAINLKETSPFFERGN